MIYRVWTIFLAGSVMSVMISFTTLVTAIRHTAHSDSANHPVVLELFTS
jgi:hypothetical protein